MAPRHPIDEDIRKQVQTYLTSHPEVNQTLFAKQIGRSQGWFNKYINGTGHATIDDLVRIASRLFDSVAPQLIDEERQVLRYWRVIPDEGKDAVLGLLKFWYRRRQRPPRSGGRSEQKTRATTNKAPGTR